VAFRIEILFSGPASDNELDRAQIIGDKDVRQAMEGLVGVLKNAGLDVTLAVRSVNSIPARNRKRLERQEAAQREVGYQQEAA
jgi:hypothetical protein